MVSIFLQISQSVGTLNQGMTVVPALPVQQATGSMTIATAKAR